MKTLGRGTTSDLIGSLKGWDGHGLSRLSEKLKDAFLPGT